MKAVNLRSNSNRVQQKAFFSLSCFPTNRIIAFWLVFAGHRQTALPAHLRGAGQCALQGDDRVYQQPLMGDNKVLGWEFSFYRK